MLSRFLAKRFRASEQHTGLISFLSKASTIGVLLGVCVLIVSLSVINGFEQQLVKRLLSVVAHVEYHAPEKPIKNWPSKLALLEQHPNVIGAAPQMKLSAMVQYGTKLKALSLEAVLQTEHDKVSQIDQYIKGTPVSSLADDEIILGKQIINELNVSIGDTITVLLADQKNSNKTAQSKRLSLTLVGSIEMGGPVDHSTGIMALSSAQRVLGFSPDEVTDIRLAVDNVFLAHQVAMEAGRLLPDLVYVSSWFRAQGSLYQDIQMVRTIIYLVVFLIIAVASFNIVSSMVMEVKEKQNDIAILKTMGAKDQTIFMTFILQGLGYAMVGAALGVFIGVLLAMNISDLFKLWVSFSESNPLEGVYFVEFLPSVVHWPDVAITVIGTLLISTLATLYPAWQATKVNPAQALGN
ncbi:Lipoprotein releasing system transmembrane protein LolE [Pseudoalteromonas luteoviolacea B = ATCC 29581]|nr:Lipoprotein releasing system transmembrane protein LolE [Pseudoalteromonas luteoviolacea B = ATCC 29581]